MSTQVRNVASNENVMSILGDKDCSKRYLYSTDIPHLFECLMSGLIHHQPANHLTFLRDCLANLKQSGGVESLRWDTFIGSEETQVTPVLSKPPSATEREAAKPKAVSIATSTRAPIEFAPLSRRLVDTGRRPDLAQTAPLILVYVGPVAAKGTYKLPGLPKNANIIAAYNSGFADVDDNDDERLREDILSKLYTNRDNSPVVLINYPRNATQLQWLLTRVGGISRAAFVDYTEEAFKNRLALSYERAFNSPTAINSVIDHYKQATIPVIHWLDVSGKLQVIDGKSGDDYVQAQLSHFIKTEFQGFARPESVMKSPAALDIMPLTDDFPEDTKVTNSLCLLFVGPVVNYNLYKMFLTGKARHLYDNTNAIDKLPAVLSKNDGPTVCLNFPSDRAQFDWFMANVGFNFARAIVIDCKEQTLRTRLLSAQMPPEDIDEAIDSYKLNTVPIIHWFDRAGKVHMIDGDSEDSVVMKGVTTVVTKPLQ